jgi:hypothetical protein
MKQSGFAQCIGPVWVIRLHPYLNLPGTVLSANHQCGGEDSEEQYPTMEKASAHGHLLDSALILHEVG